MFIYDLRNIYEYHEERESPELRLFCFIPEFILF